VQYLPACPELRAAAFCRGVVARGSSSRRAGAVRRERASPGLKPTYLLLTTTARGPASYVPPGPCRSTTRTRQSGVGSEWYPRRDRIPCRFPCVLPCWPVTRIRRIDRLPAPT
jgi:hypothetical protein